MTARTDGLLRSDAITEVEAPWVELVERHGIIAARDLLVVRGVSPATAAGIALWLSDQAERRRLVDRRTGTRYRSTLRELGCPQDGPSGSVTPFRGSSIGRACGC